MAQAAPGRSTLLHAASPADPPGSDHSFSNTEGDRECCDDSRCKHPGVRPPAIIHYMDHALRRKSLHCASGSPQENTWKQIPTGSPQAALLHSSQAAGQIGEVDPTSTRAKAYGATLQTPPHGSKVSSGCPYDLPWHPDTSQPDGLLHDLWNNIGQDEGR